MEQLGNRLIYYTLSQLLRARQHSISSCHYELFKTDRGSAANPIQQLELMLLSRQAQVLLPEITMP
jgi:hypothetical protein